MVLGNTITGSDLISFAATAKAPVKATCIEALEFATRSNPGVVSAPVIDYVIECLGDKAPRIRWESAKVIANTIHLFPAKIDRAVKSLLDNTEHEGTVVRWSAATALTAILKLKTPISKTLESAIVITMEKEEKNSIKKIYLAALKKLK